MKHIHLISRYKMRWVVPLCKYLSSEWRVTAATAASPEQPNLIIFAWADDIARDYINNTEKGDKKYVVFLRSYEYIEEWWLDIDWSKVDQIICVNDYIADVVEDYTKKKPHVIYNSVELDKWTFRSRSHGNKIAMVSHLHYKKNHPLALQILEKLSPDYSLHCAGAIQCGDIINYLDNLSKKIDRKIYIYDHIEEDKLDHWLEDKDYILSTSFREGSPNNVIECMAKGIKPIVHNWPGAKQQFGNFVFDTIDQASDIMRNNSEYNSAEYRIIAKERFGLDNYRRIKEIVGKLIEA